MKKKSSLKHHRRILGVLCALLHFVRCLFPYCRLCSSIAFFLHQL